MKTTDYLDAIKAKLNLPSDYALAKRLNVAPQKISNWRAGRDCPAPLACFRIAELLDLERDLVLASVELERAAKAGKEDQASAWKHWVERLGGVAATLVLGTVLSAPTPADARGLSVENEHCRQIQSSHSPGPITVGFHQIAP